MSCEARPPGLPGEDSARAGEKALRMAGARSRNRSLPVSIEHGLARVQKHPRKPVGPAISAAVNTRQPEKRGGFVQGHPLRKRLHVGRARASLLVFLEEDPWSPFAPPRRFRELHGPQLQMAEEISYVER